MYITETEKWSRGLLCSHCLHFKVVVVTTPSVANDYKVVSVTAFSVHWLLQRGSLSDCLSFTGDADSWQSPVPAVVDRAHWITTFNCYRTELILGLRPANERRCNFVTTSLTGWAQTLNQPCHIWSICLRSWFVFISPDDPDSMFMGVYCGSMLSIRYNVRAMSLYIYI